MPRHYGLPESRVRVIATGYRRLVRDEAARLSRGHGGGRPAASCWAAPVKYVADRIRVLRVRYPRRRSSRPRPYGGLDAEGNILAMDVEDVTAIGAFSTYPRTSVVEGNQVYPPDGRALHVP